MNIGDYVRLNNDVYFVEVINRIAEIYEDKGTLLTENDGSEYQGEYSMESVIKSSPNIIDLIEIGDYVNGERVINIIKKHGYLEVSDEEIIINKKDIKSIVTKEQFSQMEYKL